MSDKDPAVRFGAAYYAEYQRTPAAQGRLRPDGRGRVHGDPRRRVGVVDLGAGGRASSTSTGSSRSSTRPRAGHRGRSSGRRRTRSRCGSSAATPRSPARAPRAADRLGRAPGGRLHPCGVPLPRRADHPRGRHPLPRAPGGHRLPGRQRARPAAAAQRGRLPAVRRLAAPPLRHGRAAQRGVGPRLLVAPALDLGGPVAARRQLPAAVRPRLAPLPDRAGHRVHRLAGRHRPRARRTPLRTS